MGWAFLTIGGISMLVAFVCCILVIVKMFQNNQTGLGIGTIVGMFVCGIGYIIALVVGWQNKDRWALQKIMPIFTGSLILGVILYGAGYAMILPEIMKNLPQQ
jgi:NhaP-type Na+/H+ or K+/H+ antiporter